MEDQKSTILGKYFVVVQKSFLLGDYSIVDPGDKKKYAEITRDTARERMRMEHPKYVYELKFSGNIFRGKRLTLSKNNSTVLELHIPKGLFPERGHLDVFAEDDHALCLYGLFFMNVLGKPKDSA